MNYITLRSGKELEIVTNKRSEGKDTENEYVPFEKERKSTPPTKGVVKEEKEESYVPPSSYKPRVLFLQILVNSKIEDHLMKFVEVLQKLYINIPFTESLSHMPYYAKHLRRKNWKQ